MYAKFQSLKLEKQERIINAAIKEFIKSGFERASTNEIVKDAKISKGSLFNYFKNKRDLYMYLIEYTIEVIEKLYKETDLNETDIFNRIGQMGMVKFKYQKKTPQVFDFLAAILHEQAGEVKPDIDDKMRHILESGFELTYENIDFSRFREDVDIEKAIKILNWTMLGFAEEVRNRLTSFEEVTIDQLEEWNRYSELLKKSFYK